MLFPPFEIQQNFLNFFKLYFAADVVFTLTVNSMKPNGGKFLSDFQIIFDYQLSCYWRVTEKAFGIWSGKFGGFSNQANLSPEKAGIIVLVSFLALHNIVQIKSKHSCTPVEFSE